MSSWSRILPLLAAIAAVPVPALAQQRSSSAVPPTAYREMRWRLVGPYRAGWATVATGVPGHPNRFYFGASAGGVWRSDDAGRTWRGLMQHQKAVSIGALEVAPSNPDVIYAGTGRVAARYDIIEGDGVYRSDDGGEHWRNIGLRETRHIGRLWVDPRNADRVLVAALGHVYGPNPERGVYLTPDGGRHWTRTLRVDERTGAVDLAADATAPDIVYAATWQTSIHPWLDYFQPRIGPGSGIWKSTDAGQHWTRLGGAGLPAGPLGRIGLAVARGSRGNVVYASIVAPGEGDSGIYRSDDGGASWLHVNDGGALASDYFGRLTVAPDDPRTVYVMGQSIRRSSDGGHHFEIMRGAPGGDDFHFLWIDPTDPSHMAAGADQGAAVSVTGGRTWSSWYNQPTGEFYHVAADDRFPYRIYSGQQDNGTVEISSRGPYGTIELRDWHPVGGDERDYMVPKPGAPDTVFGSGLGGHVSRFDEATRQSGEVSPWPVSTYGARPTTVKYRYTWISPLVFSPLPPHPLYFGAQVLFRSDDDGDHWRVISPDLSGKKDGATGCQDPAPAPARDCGFGVIYTIAPSPVDSSEIWVGTDDGLIRLTRDGGAHWSDVTPSDVPAWGRIDAIAASAFDAQVAYAAIDLHRIDRFEPLIEKTADGGRTWQRITDGLPADEYVLTVRADPVKRGLLYAGTNRGVYVSFDDGGRWQRLSLNLPTVVVRDLLVHHGDLIAGTQGRGIWILDDVAPLRELGPTLATEPAHLFRPDTAVRMRADENRDTPWPPETPLGENPPTGAIIDYWLGGAVAGPVTLTIRDAAGDVVRRWSSDDAIDTLPAYRYFQPGWAGRPERLSAAPGMHRFVWDLREPRPAALGYEYSIAAVWPGRTPLNPDGALVLPGRYRATLSAGGRSYSQDFTVKPDPRVHVGLAALRAQLHLAHDIAGALARAVAADSAIASTLAKRSPRLGHDVAGRLADLRSGRGGIQEIAGVLSSLFTAVESADGAPTQGQLAVFTEYRERLDAVIGKWRKAQP